MGVDENVVIGTGLFIYGVEALSSRSEAFDANSFPDEIQSFVHRDAYDNQAPIAFFFESQNLIQRTMWGTGDLPLAPGDKGWSVSRLVRQSVFNKEAIIKEVIDAIKFDWHADDECWQQFEKIVQGNDVYYGKFLYRYFT
jgi:hypothetical protein